jgi:hypothetical protein
MSPSLWKTPVLRQLSEHHLRFVGLPTGEYGVTWAQLEILREIHQDGPDRPRNYNVRISGRLDHGSTMADVVQALHRLVERHEALRTTFLMGADGTFRQRIAGHGELTVPEYDVGAHRLDHAAYLAQSLIADRTFAPDELPLRAAVVSVDGRPEQIVLAVHHACADGSAGIVLCEEARLIAADPEVKLPDAWQPRQIVAEETSEQTNRHAARADAFHEQRLRNLPADQPEPVSPPPGGDVPYLQWWARSWVVPAAARLIADRHSCTTASVLLAAYGAALGAYLERPECQLELISSNREHPMLRASVVNLFQTTSIRFDTADASFAELCRRVGAAGLPAYRYGRRDPDRFARTLQRVRQDRVCTGRLPWQANLRILGARDLFGGNELGSAADGPAPDLRELRSRGKLEPAHGRVPHPEGLLKFDVWNFGDTADITLGSDAPVHSEAGLKSLFEAFEAVLVAAAVVDDELTAARLHDLVTTTVLPIEGVDLT